MIRTCMVGLGFLCAGVLLLCAGCGDDDGSGNNTPAVCGNLVCEPGETALRCPEDCGCGNNVVNEEEDCDGANLDGQTCQSLGYERGSLLCSAQCTFNTLLCVGAVCGNDIIEVGEDCEGENLQGQLCFTLGFDGGTLTCSDQCKYDVSGCEGSGCGDGVREAGEQCDGEDLAGADCTDVGYVGGTLSCTGTCVYDTSHCETPVLCGNGAVDQGEECDDMGESAECDRDCTFAECGDGLRNHTAGEQCDHGGESATCDSNCTLAECGDGTVNLTAGEECDDATETADCDSDCTDAVCGDQTVNVTAGEECDDGGETAACNANCTFSECGDGVLNQTDGEICDGGGETTTCDSDCTPAACGDGMTNQTAGEECDDGGTDPCDGCDQNCILEECGDGYVHCGEDCDEGGETVNCDSDCTFVSCGDGHVNQTAGETCDDGNQTSGDGCDANCILECGNGQLDPLEECDHGGETATCDSDCTFVSCGDGQLNVTAGEECDDGNNISGDGCDAACNSECAPASLTTHFNGGNGFDGNMFDVVTITNVYIHSFDVNIGPGSNIIVEVWFRTGTFVGHESSQTGWTMIGSASVTSTGNGGPTQLNLGLNHFIGAGQTVAFYVTVNGTVGMDYTNGTAVGNVAASNAHMQILEGNGGGYFSVTFTPRVWNGTIHYDGCP